MTWAPSYETTAHLRTYMGIPAVTVDADDIARDTVIFAPALATASREIDRTCHRQFGSVASEARYYTVSTTFDGADRFIDIDDTQASVTLAVDLDGSLTYATAVTDFATLPRNATAKGLAITRILLGSTAGISTVAGRYKATSTWGWTAVPDTIKMATLLQASRLAKRKDAPFGVAGSPEFGNELRLLAKLDPDVELMVAAYRRYV